MKYKNDINTVIDINLIDNTIKISFRTITYFVCKWQKIGNLRHLLVITPLTIAFWKATKTITAREITTTAPVSVKFDNLPYFHRNLHIFIKFTICNTFNFLARKRIQKLLSSLILALFVKYLNFFTPVQRFKAVYIVVNFCYFSLPYLSVTIISC